MNATETALKVLEWATFSPDSPIPQGSLEPRPQLTHPSLSQALQQLTRVTAAKMSLSLPFLDDNSPLSLDTLLLALALGIPNPQQSQTLLQALSPSTAPADWLARHGLVNAALPYLASPLSDTYLQLSPLSALLYHPAPGEVNQTLALTHKLLPHPDFYRCLVQHFAQPAPNRTIRDWRRELLERLRMPNLVLDVYEAMMIYYAPLTLAQIREANAVFRNPQASQEEELLQESLSVAYWWQPLGVLERENPNELRSRRYLGYDYREGIKLFNLARRLVLPST
jgi:hypothetical protein